MPSLILGPGWRAAQYAPFADGVDQDIAVAGRSLRELTYVAGQGRKIADHEVIESQPPISLRHPDHIPYEHEVGPKGDEFSGPECLGGVADLSRAPQLVRLLHRPESIDGVALFISIN